MKKIAFLCLLCAPFWVFAQTISSKIHPSVSEQFQTHNKVEVLVIMAAQADLTAADRLATKEEKGNFVFQTLSQLATTSQRGIQAYLRTQSIDFQPFWINNSLLLTANWELVRQLSLREDVGQIINNPKSHVDLPNTPLSRPEMVQTTWGIQRIKADSVWLLGHRGKGIVIGGADTGYDWMHPILKKSYRGFNATTNAVDHNYNWFDAILLDSTTARNPCGAPSRQPCDDHAHGTHTMGTMAGGAIGDTLAIGVAPDARWVAARNMDRGDGTLARYIACFEWFIAPKDTLGRNPNPRLAPHVINNSWYCSRNEGCNESNFAQLERAMLACRAAGIVTVISVGNSGPSCSTANDPPGFFQKAFSIGATRQDDTIAGFSSRGSVTVDSSKRIKPNVSAPGVSVYSSVLRGGYSSFSGTSMAGPHVAATVALMLSANPLLIGQVDTVQRILELTAKEMRTTENCGGLSGQLIPNNTYGYGRIDALAAVKRALVYRRPVKTIDNQRINDIQVYPNPFSSQISFFTEGGIQGKVSLDIFNAKGQLVARQQEKESTKTIWTVETGSWESGLFFYKIQTEKGIQTGKIIKL
jgi:serine protease AprX